MTPDQLTALMKWVRLQAHYAADPSPDRLAAVNSADIEVRVAFGFRPSAGTRVEHAPPAPPTELRDALALLASVHTAVEGLGFRVQLASAELLQSAGLPEYVRAWATVREYLSADPRPKGCRFRLMHTPDAAYPKSGCAACDWTPFRGTSCPREART